MSYHTPGPWEDRDNKIIAPAFEGKVLIDGGHPESGLVALVYAPVDRNVDWPATHAANHRLIAAAPDLLRLVKLFRHVVDANGLDPVDGDERSITEQADLLIAKVEGRPVEGV